MANKQTKSYHAAGISVINAGASPNFKTFEIGTQVSKRKSPWKGCKSDRPIVYMPEHLNKVKK
jgi:hypothetical protein